MSFPILFSTAMILALPQISHAVPITAHHSQDLSHIVVASANDSTVEEAKNFVVEFTSEGLGILANKNADPHSMDTAFRRLLNANFDMKYIGRFAVGPYWKSMNKNQQREYLKLFNDMIIHVYSKRFYDYNGEQLTVKSGRADGKYDVLVTSFIVTPSGSKVRVDWRVRKKKAGYKVIDVMVEGVSMALTQRSDFSSVIQRGGGNADVLIEHLRNY